MPVHLLAFCFLLFLSCKNQSPKTELPPSAKLEKGIPLFFGVNNNYLKPDSMKISLTDPSGKIVLDVKGYNPVWGLVSKDSLFISGRYTYTVRFFADSVSPKTFSNSFDVNGDEEKLDFSVNVSPYLPGDAEVYINKYYGNKFKLDFIRKWDPAAEYMSKDSIAPDYEIKNNYDSTIFGIYRVQSSIFATHWARLHDAAYTELEKWENNSWQRLWTNSCVIAANIKKGETGKPYPDLIYSTAKKDLKGPGKFRVSFEYGINDFITRMPDSLSKDFPNLYYETHICRCYDEFELK